jgi:hypothetical protein
MADRYDSRGRMNYDSKYHTRHKGRYSEEDMITICRMHYEGKTHTQIGLALGRTSAAISNRVVYLIQNGLYAYYLQKGERLDYVLVANHG